MTGRKARIVCRVPGQAPQYEQRDANDNTGFLESLNVKEVRPLGIKLKETGFLSKVFDVQSLK